jgi:hypothetical protein
LHNTRVTRAGIKKLTCLKNRSQLNIGRTYVTDDGLKVVASLPALSDLDGDLLTTEGLKNLRAAPRLRSLWLGWQLSAALDLAVLREFPGLESLTLTGALITDDHIKQLARNPKLKVLHLGTCERLTDQCLKAIAEIPNLEVLQITGRPLNVKAVAAFQAKKPNCRVYP